MQISFKRQLFNSCLFQSGFLSGVNSLSSV